MKITGFFTVLDCQLTKLCNWTSKCWWLILCQLLDFLIKQNFTLKYPLCAWYTPDDIVNSSSISLEVGGWECVPVCWSLFKTDVLSRYVCTPRLCFFHSLYVLAYCWPVDFFYTLNLILFTLFYSFLVKLQNLLGLWEK